jgi:antitoxin component YwqK of YwqJK toxin-antitoxin module
MFDCSVPKLEVKYHHGEKSGTETRWNCFGYIVSQTKYRNGMKNGLQTEWVPKMNMVLDDVAIEYGPTFIKMLMEDRVKVTECTYVNDCLDGKVTEWYAADDDFSDECGRSASTSLAPKGAGSRRESSLMRAKTDGQLKSVSYYLGGIENGIFTTWYPNGKKKSIGHYIMGKMQGYYYQWHTNGALLDRVYYIDDQPHGRYYQWNEEGKLIGLYYYQKGEYHGPYKQWSDQGFLLKEKTYHHGVVRGKLIKYFYNSDRIKEITEFDDDGEMHGVNEEWHPIYHCEGGVSRRWWRAHYVHGKKEGVYEGWHTHGVGGDGEGLMRRETFSGDKANGLYQSWWPNGNLSCQYIAKDGYRDGLFQRWHENGVLQEQYFSIKDCAEGLHTKWHDNGVKASEVMMVHDNPVGIYQEWDREGVLVKEKDYGDGKANLIH